MRKASFQYTDGELRVNAPLATYRLRWRPAGAVAEELAPRRDQWVPCWPDFRILKPIADDDHDDTSGRAAAYAAFRADIPPEITVAVQDFTSHQWPMLEMLSRQPKALDLMKSSPVLAFMLANNNAFRNTKIGPAGIQAAGYALRKQRFIQAWLGFPDTPAVGKLLRKIPAGEASLPLLRRLRNTLEADPSVMPLLSHRQVINTEMLSVVTHVWIMELVNPVLLEALETHKGDSSELPVSDMLFEIVRIRDEIAPRRRLQNLRTPEAVKALYEQLSEEYARHNERLERLRLELEQRQREERIRREQIEQWEERMRAILNQWPDLNETMRRRENEAAYRQRMIALAKRRREMVFSPPPIPGTADIIPLTRGTDLIEEGREQLHCTATYIDFVSTGQLYIYRVMAPERATLSIRKIDGEWQRHEVRGKGNRVVRKSTINAIDRWLRAYQHSV